ncbi:chymotrypsin-1 [Mycetomoellerius zeteki]|uniref:chymotrypsin-1 n=1 Tax=Mycetomoellerius zeteki TaxID=64791 RepID=UPI00084E5C4E|nr:PREDICTED: chymotrypsin-1-like [Trachymyrmex zeteki]
MRISACLIFIGLAYATEGAPSPPTVSKDAFIEAPIDIKDVCNAPIGKFNYQVSLRLENGTHICSGSILDDLNVLTTANCVFEWKCSLNKIQIYAGTNLLNESRYIYDINSIIIHQNYDPYLFVNDIALIHLNVPMGFNVLVHPINLPKSNQSFEGKPCTLAGWAKTNGQELQETELIVYKQKECAKYHWQLTGNSHICTSAQNRTVVCQNDFGAPLVVNGVQIGIASFGNSCNAGEPDVYTRVGSFLSWINENLKTKDT